MPVEVSPDRHIYDSEAKATVAPYPKSWEFSRNQSFSRLFSGLPILRGGESEQSEPSVRGVNLLTPQAYTYYTSKCKTALR